MMTSTLGLSSAVTSSPCLDVTPRFMIWKKSVTSSRLASIYDHGLKEGRTSCRRMRRISCEVALRSNDSSAATLSEGEQEQQVQGKIGARVRVKVPLKVYHVPRVPEVDLTGKEGLLKQYVGLWKGKRISANLPFKVEFVVDVEGRGPVKFFAHLKEDEFEYID